jgi:diguanylate cyclase (GGDEF)-like protein
MSRGSSRPAEALDAVEVALRRMRLLAAAALFAQVVNYRPGVDGGPLPLPPPALAVTLAAFVLGVNALSLGANRVRGQHLAAALRAIELACDALVMLVVLALDLVDRDVSWAMLVIPVLEGALRYRLRGVLLTWVALSLAYAWMHVRLYQQGLDPTVPMAYLAELQTTVQRLGVVLLIAIPGAYLSEQLLRDIVAQRHATQAATVRSQLLETVAEASQRITQLDVEVLDAVARAAVALGFDVADVCVADADGWRIAASHGGRGQVRLPPPGADGQMVDAGVQASSVVIDRLEAVTPAERQALADAGLQTVIVSFLGTTRDAAVRGGMRAGVDPTRPQLECLGLLARQAGIALRNGHLVGELRAMQAKLEHQAFHDALTGLVNRARFGRRLEEELAGGTSRGEIAVLYCDLDRFKAVNDSLGHAVGDELLVAVAERLRACTGEGDVVARLGGDEFALLVQEATTERAGSVAEEICRRLAVPFTLGEHEAQLGTSVGIAMAPGGALPAEELLRRADLAMYRAKQLGRSRWHWYAPELDAESQGRIQLEADLHQALERDQLQLVYQPVVHTDRGTVVGVEALLRWAHGTRGELQPASFIPLAEDSGLIVELGRWVLRRACEQAREWEQAGARPTVSVNVSPRQLLHPGFLRDLDTILTATGTDPRGLLLEITERIVSIDRSYDRVLAELHSRGVRLVLDDFGQGQTSLQHLRHLPLTALKLDKGFIEHGAADNRDRIILRSVIALAHDLGLSVIAEGVESFEHLKLLRAFGCDLVQGFYLYPPLQAEECLPLLERDAADPAPAELTRGRRDR